MSSDVTKDETTNAAALYYSKKIQINLITKW